MYKYFKMTNEMPEISEMITSFFTGEMPKEKPKAEAKKVKKRN